MADEVMALQSSFSIDTSGIDTAAQRIDASARTIAGSLTQIKTASDAAAAATKRNQDAMMASFIPLQKLQVAGLQFQDTLKKNESVLTRHAGRLMVVGQFADDMQYGLRAVVNQIPMAVTAFGGSMGLAGAI